MQPSHAVTDSWAAGPVGAVALNCPSKGIRAPRYQRAFTIVEVMVASVILVVGFMGMIQAVTVGSEMLATARRQNIAAQIITHETEKLRLKDWTYIGTTLASSAATVYASDLTDINTAIAQSGVVFNLATAVSTPTTDLREVTFTVTWTKSGTSAEANLATGSWLQRISFGGSAPINRTYTRSSTAYFGKYGLNLNVQRS